MNNRIRNNRLPYLFTHNPFIVDTDLMGENPSGLFLAIQLNRSYESVIYNQPPIRPENNCDSLREIPYLPIAEIGAVRTSIRIISTQISFLMNNLLFFIIFMQCLHSIEVVLLASARPNCTKESIRKIIG